VQAKRKTTQPPQTTQPAHGPTTPPPFNHPQHQCVDDIPDLHLLESGEASVTPEELQAQLAAAAAAAQPEEHTAIEAEAAAAAHLAPDVQALVNSVNEDKVVLESGSALEDVLEIQPENDLEHTPDHAAFGGSLEEDEVEVSTDAPEDLNPPDSPDIAAVGGTNVNGEEHDDEVHTLPDVVMESGHAAGEHDEEHLESAPAHEELEHPDLPAFGGSLHEEVVEVVEVSSEAPVEEEHPDVAAVGGTQVNGQPHDDEVMEMESGKFFGLFADKKEEAPAAAQPAANATAAAEEEPAAGGVAAFAPDAAGLLAEAELMLTSAKESAAAAAEAVLHPEDSNYGTGAAGIEKLPIVWTTEPVDGKCAAGYSLEGPLCRRCAQGFVRGEAESECHICGPGTYADVTLQACKPCAPGNYAYWHASTRCLWCLPNTYADTEGSVKCKPCPAGTTSGYQATKCT